MEDIENQAKVNPEGTLESNPVGSLEGAGGALNSLERGDEERGGGLSSLKATKLGDTDTYLSNRQYQTSKKSYYTEDEEESKISQKRAHFMLDNEFADRGDYKSGGLEMGDLESGVQPGSHNVNGMRKSRTLAAKNEFDELQMNRTDDELSVISFEQVNQSHFQVFSILQPLFWLLYYMFCCCLIPSMGSYEQDRRNRNMIQHFRHTLKTLKQKRLIDSEVFNTLVQLYKHQPMAYNLLLRVRLNPDFSQGVSVRSDLEFFIPQLCSFYLTNELGEQEEEHIRDVLCKACQVNFFFAHRVWFFLCSNLQYMTDESQMAKVQMMLDQLEMIACNSYEQLYLANSQVFLEVLHQTDAQALVDAECQFVRHKSIAPTEDYMKGYIKQIVSQRYRDNYQNQRLLEAKQKTIGINGNQFYDSLLSGPEKAENKTQSRFRLLPFSAKANGQPSGPEEEKRQATKKDIYQLRAFKSTPNFIGSLTNLCVTVLEQPEFDQKLQTLLDGLRLINKSLPASVYIPFVNKAWRNYCVLNIIENESKLFVTNTKAPYLVCLEVYRPEEILITSQNKFKQLLPNQDTQSITHSMHQPQQDAISVKSIGQSNYSAKVDKNNIKKNQSKIEHLVKRLHLNADRQLSQGQIIKNFFPQYVDQNEFESIERPKIRAYNTMVAGQEFEGYKKRFLSQGNLLEDQKDQEKYSNNESDNEENIFKESQDAGDQPLPNTRSRSNSNKRGIKTVMFQKSVKAHTPHVINERDNELQISEDEIERISTGGFYGAGPRQGRIMTEENPSEAENLDKILLNNQIRLAALDPEATRLKKQSSDIGYQKRQFAEITGIMKTASAPGEVKNSQLSVDEQQEVVIPSQEEEEKFNNSYSTGMMKNAVDWLVYEPNFLYKEFSNDQESRIRAASPYGQLQTWKLCRLIVKCGDDMRLEQFAMQLISLMNQIFKRKNLKLWLKPYEIIATSHDTGLIEFIEDGLGLDYIRKTMSARLNRQCDLCDYFRKNFGYPSRSQDILLRSKMQKQYERAVHNFADSLAAYSLVCYILQIKDRHNANMIIDKEGHLIHIDFGFMLTDAPGKGLRFETAPFKLTAEFVRILGGPQGNGFARFRNSMIQGFEALNKHSAKIILLVQMVANSQKDLSCFNRGTQVAVDELKDRLNPKGMGAKLSRADCEKYIDQLINESEGNWRTQMYDGYQYCWQGIY